MGERTAWIVAGLVLAVLGTLAFWLWPDVKPTALDTQRAFERTAHERLIRAIQESGNGPAPFRSDGCSGGLSTAWRSLSDRFPSFAEAHRETPPWEHCCLAHDLAYHGAGGAGDAQESYDLRLAADETLRICVFETRQGREAELSSRYGLSEEQIEATYTVLADAMFDAVRLGGLPCTGLAWRWGYGYPPCSRPVDDP